MALRPAPPALPARYRLWPDGERAFLGSGGAASVWRVQDQDLGVLVALKVLKDTRPGFLVKMEREAILASRVVHPNVVAVHDIGRSSSTSLCSCSMRLPQCTRVEFCTST